MDVQVSVVSPIAPGKFADITLTIENESTPCRLKLDFATLRSLGKLPPQVVLDFLLVASIVYSLDRRIARHRAEDAWTREFTVTVPVADVEIWQRVNSLLDQCVSFLTGDIWDFHFTDCSERLVLPFSHQVPVFKTGFDAVSLFSGGLDSLIGVIDHLESCEDTRLVLVGHHDPRIGSAFSDQQIVFEELESYYPDHIYPLLPFVGADSGRDTTLRSRSLLFLALGLYAAQTLSDATPVLIPENGTIALNVPLTDSRTGSCSTRTTHPYYLDQLNRILKGLTLGTRVINPLEDKTKGECVSHCLNQAALGQIAPYTISCAKRGHTRTWLRRKAKQCGRCMPCIYRRAALHASGMDAEMYGRDICQGEVDITSDLESADDFRACVSFLKKNYTPVQIAELLLLNGRLDVARLDSHAEVVFRAMEEVRALLRDKGTPVLKTQLDL